MVRYQEYLKINVKDIKNSLRTPILIDSRSIYNRDEVQTVGLIYVGTGVAKN